ncbi:MAG: hypothetical protein ACOYOP_16225 [Microthrixaceae bacterium]
MASSTSVSSRRRKNAPGPNSSRAVLRDVEPGSSVDCAHCGERVKFQAKVRHRQVICNVYVDGRWDRVEHFHSDCYEVAGQPHGDVDTTPVVKARARADQNPATPAPSPRAAAS